MPLANSPRTALLLMLLMAASHTVAQSGPRPPPPPPPPPGAPPPPGMPQPPLQTPPVQAAPLPPEPPSLPIQAEQPAAATPSASPEPAAVIDEEAQRLQAARNSGDAERLGDELIRQAQARLNDSQPRLALPPLNDAISLANRNGNDRLGREAAMMMANAYDRLGDSGMSESWRQQAEAYRARIVDRSAPAPLGGPASPAATAAAPSAVAPSASGNAAMDTPRSRWPWWLAAISLLLGLAWWQSRRRAADLHTETQALTRQQRQLRSAHQQLKQQTEQFRQMAVQDALTGAMNRQAFASEMQGFLDHAEAVRKPVALFVFDLDHFKQINDRYGHLAGDAALKLLVGVVRENLDSADLFGRFGGDEFLIGCMDQEPNASKSLAERIRAAVVARSANAGPEQPPLSVSIGIAHATPISGYSLEHLFHRADTALYAAKRAGRNRAVLEDLAHPPPPEDQPSLRTLA